MNSEDMRYKVMASCTTFDTMRDFVVQVCDALESIDKTKNILKNKQKNTVDDIYDDGFYNGIETALALLENREPVFRDYKRK